MSTTTPERRKHPRSEQPTLEEIRACFHRLWSSQVGTKEYNKHDWQELSKLLQRKGPKPMIPTTYNLWRNTTLIFALLCAVRLLL